MLHEQSAADEGVAGAAPGEAVWSRLLDALERRPHFQALAATIRRVERLAKDDNARLQTLVTHVGRDPALSARLLRMINAAYYRSLGGGPVGDIDRAVTVLGFDAVCRLATALPLLEDIDRGPQGRVLREDFLRALLAAHIADALGDGGPGQGELYVTALFQNLGRMLVAAYLPADAMAVRAAVPRSDWPLIEREDRAARQSLGLAYGELGARMAKAWGWPAPMRLAMQRVPMAPVDSGLSETRRFVGSLGNVANDLADLMLYVPPARWRGACERLARQPMQPPGLGAERLHAALTRVRPGLEELVELVGLQLGQLCDWHQAAPPGDANGSVPVPVPVADAVLDALDALDELEDPVAANEASPGPAGEAPAQSPDADPSPTEDLTPPVPAGPPPRPRRAADVLAEEALALSETLLQEALRHEVPQRALAAMQRGLQSRRAVLMLRQPRQAILLPTRVLGEPLRPLPPGRHWWVDTLRGTDLYARICARQVDTFIRDAGHPPIKDHLPAGYEATGPARSFLLLPLVTQGAVVGLIHVDWADDAVVAVDEAEMRQLRTLRNQMLMAIHLGAAGPSARQA